MNILLSSYSQYNNSSPKLQKSKVTFGAGWSAQIEKEIEKCNISQIADTFKIHGIPMMIKVSITHKNILKMKNDISKNFFIRKLYDIFL